MNLKIMPLKSLNLAKFIADKNKPSDIYKYAIITLNFILKELVKSKLNCHAGSMPRKLLKINLVTKWIGTIFILIF